MTIYLAGGCFWGVSHFFSQVTGVKNTVCGYANGNIPNPTYEQVYTDKTGFAETVAVTFRPEVVALEDIIRLFFCIIDPTSLNRQGEDCGTRYRTGIYYESPIQKVALQGIVDKERARYGDAFAVEFLQLENFFPAEERHQDYLEKNPSGYCHIPLKALRYIRAWNAIRLSLEGETDEIARMATAAAVLYERMQFFWVGFYRVVDRHLVIGPYQGPQACLRIAYGKGVCGSAWKQGRTVIVPDVEQFPGHIACSSLSRSEIVVPVIRGGQVTGVLDIDSDRLNAFDETDGRFLELILN